MKYRSVKRHVDKACFMNCLNNRGCSIRGLCRYVDINEKTIRRILQEGCGTVSVLYTIAKFLDVSLEELCGTDISTEWIDFRKRVM